jgi:cephalosporin hydroxylase
MPFGHGYCGDMLRQDLGSMRTRAVGFVQKVIANRQKIREIVPPMVVGRFSARIFQALNLLGRSDAYVRMVRVPAALAFNKLYYYLRKNTFDPTFFLGKHVLKFPTDLWAYQELLFERRPDVIVETGVFLGGSTYYFAKLLQMLEHGRVISIDATLDHVDPELSSMPNVTLLEGDTSKAETFERVRKLIRPGEKVMVVLDSDHATNHVLAEMELFSQLVTEGQYLVVEDGLVDEAYPVFCRNGPRKAIKKFLESNSGFVPEFYWNRFLLSHNPSGYLLRTSGREQVRFRTEEDCYRPLGLWLPGNPPPWTSTWMSKLGQNKT